VVDLHLLQQATDLLRKTRQTMLDMPKARQPVPDVRPARPAA
jgi:hypothetical protein